MKHTSVKLDSPCEFINITPVNPLISKCQIKVCYVGEEPNRNRSVITKEVATQMANSLPGCPIVGFYNEASGDFEEHNRTIDISNGEFKIKDTTIPYGFVDMNAKVWFQKFLDDGVNEHEYLMTEGYIWTGQYPQAQRIIEKGNNQSMELAENYLDATWSKSNNGEPQFFIINEAIISKLCILGEDFEPCFEGANIAKIEFSFEDNFQTKLFSMMDELKELIKEGGTKQVYTRYAVEIGDALWTALYSHIEKAYPDLQNYYCSVYRVEGIFEDNGQKFAVLQSRADMKYYRLNFSLTDETGFVPSETLIEVTKTYSPTEGEPQFALEAVEQFEAEYIAQKKVEENENAEDKTGEENTDNSDNNSEEGEETKELCPKCGKEIEQCECEPEDNIIENKYNLEEVVEYAALLAEHEELKNKYSALEEENTGLKAQLEPLVQFKQAAERKEKEAMIEQFYMLSDEDKAEVVENIDKYSVDEIEAKLSVICVRNKVSFNLEEEGQKLTAPTTYNLNDSEDDASTPAWVKAVIANSEKRY